MRSLKVVVMIQVTQLDDNFQRIPNLRANRHIDRSVETAGLHAVTLRNRGSGCSFTWKNLVPDAASLDQRDVAASGAPRRAICIANPPLSGRPAAKGICVAGRDFRANRLGFVQIPIVPSARVSGTDANRQAAGSRNFVLWY
jgi:hypothetical protein